MPLSLSDRIFWSVALMILVWILWLAFLEQYPKWGSLIIGIIIAMLIMKFGGREIGLKDLVSRMAKFIKKRV
jgi:multisubunit Na+/H+ antiporter MnhE subunit